MDNYYNLLNIGYKKHILIYIISIILFILFILSLCITSYDSYKTYGIYKESTLLISVPVNNSDNLLTGKYLQVNKEKYNYIIKDISDLYVEGNINYQVYKISIDKTFLDNEVIEITFYSNKEKIIKKIIRKLF